ncbi:hypothetical protein [Azospirillum sp. ST 5-10]
MRRCPGRRPPHPDPQAKFNHAEAVFREALLAEVRDLPVEQRLPTSGVG